MIAKRINCKTKSEIPLKAKKALLKSVYFLNIFLSINMIANDNTIIANILTS